MVKRKRSTSGRKTSERALKAREVLDPREEGQKIAKESVQAEPLHLTAMLGSNRTPDYMSSSNPEQDDIPQGLAVEFKHDSILRVSSSSAMCASSSDGEVGGTAKRLALSANEESSGKQTASLHSRDAASERKEFTVLRSGEKFGTHFSLLRVEMPGIQFSGAAWLSVVDGTVGIFGAVLDPEDPPALVSSAPFSSVILTLKPQKRESSIADKARRENATHPEALVHLKIRKAVSNGLRKLSGKRCIVLLTSFSSSLENLAASDGQQNNTDVFYTSSVYPSLTGFRAILSGSELLPTASVPCGPSKFPVFQEWQNSLALMQDINNFLCDRTDNKPLRVLVCGARGTGKSTLTRYLMNYLLLRKTRVVLIDTDVGQPEMNPPGLIAAHVVSDFRLGAPAASTRNVPMSARFLGETTPREEPDLYERFAQQVIGDAITFAEANNYPTVINSDGWVNGVGADLLHRVADCTKPTHVVQLKFPDQSEKQSLSEICARVGSDRSYIFTSLGSLSDASFSSSIYRDSQTASYFCKEWTLGRVYKVPLGDLQVASSEMESTDLPILHLLNGCMVALGETRNRERGSIGGDCNIKGLGIIRGVDPQEQVLYLCSPLSLDTLASCNRIIQSGGVQLPHGFVACAAAIGKTPYLLGGGIFAGNVMRSRKTLTRR